MVLQERFNISIQQHLCPPSTIDDGSTPLADLFLGDFINPLVRSCLSLVYIFVPYDPGNNLIFYLVLFIHSDIFIPIKAAIL